MSTAGETAWHELAKTWRVGPTIDPSQIRRLADRQTRRMRLVVLAEVAVTLVTAGVVWWVLRVERGAVALGWAVAAGLHAGVVWGFSIWNRIGIWRPLGESTAAYLRLARERLRRQRRSATFTLWLVGIEVAALLAWLRLDADPGRTPRSGWAWFPAAVVTTTAIGWAWWYRVRAVRQLARLGVLESQLIREGGDV